MNTIATLSPVRASVLSQDTTPTLIEQVETTDPAGELLAAVVPYRNTSALIGYYAAVFSMIPVAGFVLGPPALIMGFVGLAHAWRNPGAHGWLHGFFALAVGGLSCLVHYGLLAATIVAALTR